MKGAAPGPQNLIIRRHAGDDGVQSRASYSACGRYRYALTRTWDARAPRIAFVMLNPSTASEVADDPTVGRCVRRARVGGWGAIRICNLFALRETHPERLKAHAAPEGPDNKTALADACRWADAVVAAWGVHGAHLGRGPEAAVQLRSDARSLLHLGLTKAGHPRHPLYLSYGVPLLPWE